MADEDSETETDNKGTRYDVPLKVAAWCMVIFALWTLGVSIAHALSVGKFDLTSVILAELAVAPTLLFLVKSINVTVGKYTVSVQTNRILTALVSLQPFTTRALETPKEPLPAITGTANITLAPATVTASGIVANPVEPAPLAATPDDELFKRLRREIMDRLRKVAIANGVGDARFHFSPHKLVDELTRRQIIGPSDASALRELINASNADSHGLAPGIAEFTRDEGDRLLGALDNLALKPEVELMNAVLEKAGPVDTQFDVASGMSGIVIPDEVALEVRGGAPSKLAQTVALQKLRLEIERKRVKGGILVLSKKPKGVEDKQETTGDFELAYAWKNGEGFAGDALARRLAPWLFQ